MEFRQVRTKTPHSSSNSKNGWLAAFEPDQGGKIFPHPPSYDNRKQSQEEKTAKKKALSGKDRPSRLEDRLWRLGLRRE